VRGPRISGGREPAGWTACISHIAHHTPVPTPCPGSGYICTYGHRNASTRPMRPLACNHQTRPSPPVLPLIGSSAPELRQVLRFRNLKLTSPVRQVALAESVQLVRYFSQTIHRVGRAVTPSKENLVTILCDLTPLTVLHTQHPVQFDFSVRSPHH